jgi:hypothetical protein
MDQQGHLIFPNILTLLVTEDTRLALKQNALNTYSFAYKFSFCSFLS